MRKNVIVLEGSDGTGKTTLASTLSVQGGFAIEHSGPPEKNSIDYYMDRIRAHGVSTVLDRWHGGSYIYGSVFRGMDDLTPYERWQLEGVAMAQGAVMVYCNGPQKMDEAPADSDASIYEVPAKQQAIRDHYETFVNSMTQLYVVKYDWTKTNALEMMTRRLIDHHAWFNDRAMIPESIPAVGNIIEPKYVFVADEPAGRLKVINASKRLYPEDINKQIRFCQLNWALPDWYDQRPFPTSSSGRYLHWALTVAKLSLQDYCIVNSRQLDGSVIEDWATKEILARPGWRKARVVALGNDASQRLEFAGIEHDKIYHPSYWKRFHYKEVDTYAKQLKGS